MRVSWDLNNTKILLKMYETYGTDFTQMALYFGCSDKAISCKIDNILLASKNAKWLSNSKGKSFYIMIEALRSNGYFIELNGDVINVGGTSLSRKRNQGYDSIPAKLLSGIKLTTSVGILMEKLAESKIFVETSMYTHTTRRDRKNSQIFMVDSKFIVYVTDDGLILEYLESSDDVDWKSWVSNRCLLLKLAKYDALLVTTDAKELYDVILEEINMYKKNKGQNQMITKQFKIDDVFVKIAQNYANLSKCVSFKVGAIIVDKKGRIVASGCNGSPSGLQNCCDKFPNYRNEMMCLTHQVRSPGKQSKINQLRHEHHEWSIANEIHAETNAIAHSNRDDLIGATLYCTLQPCASCSVIIAGTGITRVVFDKYYDKSNPRSEEVFTLAKIRFNQHGANETILDSSVDIPGHIYKVDK